MFKLKLAEVKDLPLQAVLYGLPCSGKSTALGTFGKTTLILHTAEEAHGARAAIKIAAARYPGVIVHPINISIKDATDVELGLFSEKTPTALTPDLMWDKLLFYIKNAPEGVGAIGVDSLTEIFRFIKESKAFIRLCTQSGDKGASYNKWLERSAYISMLHALVAELEIKRSLGVDIVCTIAGKGVYNEIGEMISLVPDLPMFGLAEDTVKTFSDILPVHRRAVITSTGDTAEHVVFDMNMIVGKVQKTEKGVLKNSFRSFGRLSSLEATVPFGAVIDYLPVDFNNLKSNIETLLGDDNTEE